jgi:hypothetical protein
MREFLTELHRRDPLLARTAGLHLGVLVVLIVAMAFDARQVMGVNVWIKPSKFAASIAIYLATLAWLMVYVPGPGWAKGLVRWGASLAMIGEMICLVCQAARGTTSHFNDATAFDGAVFSTMGLLITFNTLLEFLVLAMFLRPYPALPPAYLLGIRVGLIGAILSAAVGFLMIAHGSHTVGAGDGGPGLWLVNWSTQAGDLRAAHAVGLHALQVLPLAGWFWSRLTTTGASVRGLVATAAIYGAVFAGLIWQALAGVPILRPDLLV